MKNVFKIGDYIITQNLNDTILAKFYLENTIGQIKEIHKYIEPSEIQKEFYEVKFLNTPENILQYFPYTWKVDKNIFPLSPDKMRFATEDEIENHLTEIDSIKYNL